MSGFFSSMGDIAKAGTATGVGGQIASFLGGPWGMMLGGIGSMFGNRQAQRQFEQGRSDIQKLPGMRGPSWLKGDFGTSSGAGFGFNQQMGAANQMIGSNMAGLLGYNNPYMNLDVMSPYMAAQQALSQQMDPMNQLSAGSAQGLFDQGFSNLQAAGDTSGIYNSQLDIMREAYAPQRQTEQNMLLDDLYSKGLLGANTATQGQSNILDRFFESGRQADLSFQQTAFDRAQAEANRLGNLGISQIGQGFGAEAQAYNQALGALAQNQQAGMNRLGAAQGLFGLGNELFNQRYGLGLQGAETLLGYGDFGLRGAAMPYQLQAGLLQGGGYHAQALAGLAGQQADATAGFFGGLFG